MRVKNKCIACGGAGHPKGCELCDGKGYVWLFERDPEVTCCACGESFREGSQEAEFVGQHGACHGCFICDDKVEVCDD